MTKVAKYNLFKGISTALTFGTPIITMMISGNMFVKQPSTAISGAAVFAFLLSALLLKDKLAEKFKSPSALVISVAVFILCAVVENIILPMKIISITTIIACATDELSFKRLYKGIEIVLPQETDRVKRFGFIMARQSTVDVLSNRTDDKGGKQ